MNSLILNDIFKEKKDLLKEGKNMILQITSPYNQINNEYNNISNIDLGECENILKSEYNINDNESLIIFKIDIYEEGLLIPIIEYEVYDIKNKKQLDLSYCDEVKIKISIPVSIDKNNLFKYNISSDYYNDICYSFSTEKNSDIILKDRRNEYINKNMSLCENNCEFSFYNSTNNKSICECYVKIQFPIISEIKINRDRLLNNFANLKESSNIYVLKCYKNLLSTEGIKYNIGFYFWIYIFYKYNIILIFYN